MELTPFTKWSLNSTLQESLQQSGFVNPTEVQQACWDDILSGADLLVQSCTGTGKTLAFALPLLNDPKNARPSSILVVLPTRELAMQVARVITSLGSKAALLYGGGSYHEQMRALKQGAPVIVGTPGRLIDHLERGSLNLSDCRALVLDEADEILDMGFAEELDKILAALPSQRQTLLFSATMPSEMEELAKKTLHEGCRRISISIGLTAAHDIRHEVYLVAKEHRPKALSNILHAESPQLAIIFCHTKIETDELTQTLIKSGLNVLSLHGDMAQAERTRTLSSFRSGAAKYLVATDVAARGLDVEGVTHVINMAPPQNTETYIHRVGRTGRAGKRGTAITFAARHEFNRFKRLTGKANIDLELGKLPQAEEVRRRIKSDFHKEIAEKLSSEVDENYRLLAAELLCYLSPADSLAAVLSMLPRARAIFKAGYNVSVQELDRGSKTNRAEKNSLVERAAKKASVAAADGMSFIQINLGRSDGISVPAVLRMLGEAAAVSKAEVGDIELRSHTSFIELPSSEAASVLEALNNFDFGVVRIRARLITPEKLKALLPPQELKFGKHKKSVSSKGHSRCSEVRRSKKKERQDQEARRSSISKLSERRGIHEKHPSSRFKKETFNRGGKGRRRSTKR
ncbi:MAG: DEAD/DEAH box helicase [Candidatus Bruticola sp.]